MMRQAISPRFETRIFLNMALVFSPFGVSFLEKGGHAFLPLWADPQPGDHLGCVALGLVHAHSRDPLEELLALGERFRTGAQKETNDLLDSVIQRLMGDDLVDQADFQGAVRIELLAGQEELPGCALADSPDDIRPDGSRDEGNLDLAQPELGPVRSDDDIAGREQPGAAADDRPVDPGNRRLWQRLR